MTDSPAHPLFSRVPQYEDGRYFYSLDPDFRFEYVCSATERLWKRPFFSLQGKSIWEEFPAARETEAYDRHLLAMRECATQRYIVFSASFQKWYRFTLRPQLTGSLYCFFEDIKSPGAPRSQAAGPSFI